MHEKSSSGTNRDEGFKGATGGDSSFTIDVTGPTWLLRFGVFGGIVLVSERSKITSGWRMEGGFERVNNNLCCFLSSIRALLLRKGERFQSLSGIYEDSCLVEGKCCPESSCEREWKEKSRVELAVASHLSTIFQESCLNA